MSKYLNKQTVIDVLKESDLQRDAINLLKVAGWLVFRMNAGRAKFNVSLCPAGTPDILAVSKTGRALWIEFKTLDGKLRPEQIKMHTDLILRNQQVCVIRTLEEVQRIVNL